MFSPELLHSRHAGLVPPDKMANTFATVIGVGAGGRLVALQLAAMRVGHLQLIDFDTVGTENLVTQMYLEEDLDRFKVDATGDLCLKLNPSLDLQKVNGRFGKDQHIGPVVFVCVDKIDTRKFIWEAVQDKIQFLVDARMTGETLRVITVVDQAGFDHYPKTLFRPEEAYRGACTAKTTLYMAFESSSKMVRRWVHWMRGLPMEPDVVYNILADEISSMTEQPH